LKAIGQPILGTTDEWQSTDPILYEGVLGIEIRSDGTRRKKTGDGVRHWQQLEYDDGQLQQNISAEAAIRAQADNQLQQNISAEAAIRAQADSAKMDKAVAGAPGTLLQSITIKEDTVNSVIVTGWSVGVQSPGAPVATDVPLPLASETRAGIMPGESFAQISENTQRIESLEGRGVFYVVSLSSSSPSQEDLQTAYETASGKTGPAADQTTLTDSAFNKQYTWYNTSTSWVDRGTASVGQFSNNSYGLIRGHDADGKVFAENDGTGSVVGWTALKNRVAGATANAAADTLILRDAGGRAQINDPLNALDAVNLRSIAYREVINIANANDVTITLPDAANEYRERTYYRQGTGTGLVLFATTGGQTIDYRSLDWWSITGNGFITLVPVGGNWKVRQFRSGKYSFVPTLSGTDVAGSFTYISRIGNYVITENRILLQMGLSIGSVDSPPQGYAQIATLTKLNQTPLLQTTSATHIWGFREDPPAIEAVCWNTSIIRLTYSSYLNIAKFVPNAGIGFSVDVYY
jgi:hypothetical protein